MATPPVPPLHDKCIQAERKRSEANLAHKDTFFFAEYKTIAFFYHTTAEIEVWG